MTPPKSLRKFYEITLSDPLFAAEGLNLDNSQEALIELKKITHKLQLLTMTFPEKLASIIKPGPSLHPIEFLKSFLESEKQRRLFIKEPNYSSAKNLISSYSRTHKALIGNLITYRDACANVQKRATDKNPRTNSYNFYGRRVSFKDYLGAINLMINNAIQLGNDIEYRRRLLLNSIESELFSKKNKTVMRAIKTSRIKSGPLEAKGPRAISKSKQEIVQWAEQGRDQMYYMKKKFGKISTKLIGPIYYTLPQFDKKNTTHQFFVSIANDSKGKLRMFSPILTDRFHFLELAEDKYKFYADIFTYTPLLKRGINFWYQPATSFYFTSDLTYYADLATIVDLKLRPKLDKKAILNQKSSLLDLFLWNGYYHNLGYFQNISARIRAGKKVTARHYILIGRSYPTLYFLPFNRSVWRINQKLDLLGDFSDKPHLYITLNQLPRTLTKKNLKDIFYGGAYRAQEIDR